MPNNEPIYIQIAESFKRLIDLGVYKDKDPLPSVREVALNYGVNPNTAVRSYSKLIEEGYVKAVPKKGYYVLGNISPHSPKRIEEAIKPLLDSGYTKEEIQEVIAKWKFE